MPAKYQPIERPTGSDSPPPSTPLTPTSRNSSRLTSTSQTLSQTLKSSPNASNPSPLISNPTSAPNPASRTFVRSTQPPRPPTRAPTDTLMSSSRNSRSPNLPHSANTHIPSSTNILRASPSSHFPASIPTIRHLPSSTPHYHLSFTEEDDDWQPYPTSSIAEVDDDGYRYDRFTRYNRNPLHRLRRINFSSSTLSPPSSLMNNKTQFLGKKGINPRSNSHSQTQSQSHSHSQDQNQHSSDSYLIGGRRENDQRRNGIPSEREVAILKSCALSSVIVLSTIASAACAMYVFRHPENFSIIYFTTLSLGLASSFALLLLGAAGGHAHAPLTALLTFAVLSVFLLVLHLVKMGYIGETGLTPGVNAGSNLVENGMVIGTRTDGTSSESNFGRRVIKLVNL